MTQRTRTLAVLAIIATGALGVISSTQTWLVVTLADGATEDLLVPGASAVAVLAPLSLAVLALGGALSIVGLVLRYVFGVLATVAAILLGGLTAQVVVEQPVTAVAATVTEATGITGTDAVAGLVAQIGETPWPALTLAAWVVLLATGLFTLATARNWPATGGRYRTQQRGTASATAAPRPHDAIDSWDDLSRGQDPTA